MSFKLFGIEFDGTTDTIEIGKEKMDKVCQLMGEKLIRQWVEYGTEKGKIDKENIKHLYKWIKILEDCDLNDLKEDIDEN